MSNWKAFPSDKDKDEIFKPFFLQENDSSVDEWIEEGHYSKDHPDSNKNRLQHTGCRTKQRKTRALLKTQSHQVSFRIYVDYLGLGKKIASHPEIISAKSLILNQ